MTLAELWPWLEGSALGTWARESPSIWAYPTILTLHTAGLAILVGAAAVVDLRLLGFGSRLSIRSLRPLFRVMAGAFAVNAITGIVLFMSAATTRAGQRVFHVKLLLLLGALAATFAIGKAMRPALVTGDDLPSAVRLARPLAAVSLLLWTGTIVAGRLMAYL